jgi:CRP/FNR family transcriptional regulator, cyclic AMP receptor protein
MPQAASPVQAVGACTWYIRHVDLFRRLSEHDASELTSAMTPTHFAAGELIVGPEAGTERVYVTRSGTVRLFRRANSGRDVTIERLEAGHLFGVTQLLGNQLDGLLAEAETDVEACVVEERYFLDILARWPKAVLELAARLGVRVLNAADALGPVSPTSVRARLARTLHAMAQEAQETEPGDDEPGGGLRLRAVPRHSDLATQIGASRETVTRMLARLEEDGYIRRFGRQIVVPDVNRLAEDFDLYTH